MRHLMIVLPDFNLADQFSNTPSGPLYVKHMLEQIGADVNLLDLRFCGNATSAAGKTFDYLRNSRFNFDSVMLSAAITNAESINAVAHSVKRWSNSIVTVLGGPHVSALNVGYGLSKLRNLHPEINVFVSGMLTSRTCASKLSDVASNTELFEKSVLLELNSNIIEQYSLCPPLNYEALGAGALGSAGVLGRSTTETKSQNITFSIGCAFNCSFCFNRMKRRSTVTPKEAVDEMVRRKDEYGVRSFKINDDDPFADLNWNNGFIEQLKKLNFPISFLASTRCDMYRESCLKGNQMQTLSTLGLKVLGLGVEFADNNTLLDINKRMTVERIKGSIKWLSDNTDIDIFLYTIFGLPGLSEKSVNNHCDFLRWCKAETKVKHVNITALVPLPGTDIYENPDKYGMEISPDCVIGGAETDWSAFSFVGDYDVIRARPKGMADEEYLRLKTIVFRTMKDCGYLRPEAERDMASSKYVGKN